MPLLVAAICAGCGLVPFADANTGLECQRSAPPGAVVRDGDPTAVGEPLAGLDVTAMSAAEVGQAADAKGLAATWRYTFDIGEADGTNGYSECWCVPPPDGRVTDLAYDSAGRVVVFVSSGQVLVEPRRQPRQGWGCPDAMAGGMPA
jgi:hypothetical protein